jgi:hypothetical protein
VFKFAFLYLLIRVSLLTLAVGRYALNYSYVLAIPSQAKLAPYEPDRGRQNNPLDIRPAGFCLYSNNRVWEHAVVENHQLCWWQIALASSIAFAIQKSSFVLN